MPKSNSAVEAPEMHSNKQPSHSEVCSRSAKRVLLNDTQVECDTRSTTSRIALDKSVRKDYLSMLNEYVASKGPQNKKTVVWTESKQVECYMMTVCVGGTVVGSGSAKTKKLAKQAAAKQVLLHLGVNGSTCKRADVGVDVQAKVTVDGVSVEIYKDMLKTLSPSDLRVSDLSHEDIPDPETLLRLYEKQQHQQPSKLNLQLSRRAIIPKDEFYGSDQLQFQFTVQYKQVKAEGLCRNRRHAQLRAAQLVLCNLLPENNTWANMIADVCRSSQTHPDPTQANLSHGSATAPTSYNDSALALLKADLRSYVPLGCHLVTTTRPIKVQKTRKSASWPKEESGLPVEYRTPVGA
uniref:Pasha n=1 Tax=Creolimax fragrantissima TaxID=470921 RepID=A0A383QU66_CREFR|nr:Pasha [Creolimax fragrantissima]|eukprot:CFRG6281T1